MIIHIYILLSVVALGLFWVSYFDFFAHQSNDSYGRPLPMLVAAITSIMLFGFTFTVQIEGQTLASWEQLAVAFFWFLHSIIGFLLTIVMYLDTAKETAMDAIR